MQDVDLEAGQPEEEIELGFDFALFGDRISGEFTYFDQDVDDAIVPQQLAPSDPFTGQIQANVGQMSNWGWEATISARVVETQNFAFDLDVAADHSDNVIDDLGPQILEDENFVDGLPFPNTVLNHVVSVDGLDEDGNPVNPMCDNGVLVGDPSEVSDRARVPGGELVPCQQAVDNDRALFVGRAFPTFTWTFSPTFTLFNRVQIFGQIDSQYGRWNASIDADDRNDFRGPDAEPDMNNSRQSQLQNDPMTVAAVTFEDERWLGRFDADFWKLREVGARFQFPDSWVQGWGADRASFSVSGTNLWIIWQRTEKDRSGTELGDPEQRAALSAEPNFSFRNLPPLMSLNATLRVSF